MFLEAAYLPKNNPFIEGVETGVLALAKKPIKK